MKGNSCRNCQVFIKPTMWSGNQRKRLSLGKRSVGKDTDVVSSAVADSKPLHRSEVTDIPHEESARDSGELWRPSQGLPSSEREGISCTECDPIPLLRPVHHVTFLPQFSTFEAEEEGLLSTEQSKEQSMKEEQQDYPEGTPPKDMDDNEAEGVDEYETPPTSPTLSMRHRISFLCSIDENRPLDAEDLSSFAFRRKSRSSSKESNSSYDMPFEDARESVSSKHRDSRDMSPGSQNSRENSPMSPKHFHGSTPYSSMGLYQRRRMKRRILRLQSLEEVISGKILSEAAEYSSVMEGDAEEDLDETFLEVSSLFIYIYIYVFISNIKQFVSIHLGIETCNSQAKFRMFFFPFFCCC